MKKSELGALAQEIADSFTKGFGDRGVGNLVIVVDAAGESSAHFSNIELHDQLAVLMKTVCDVFARLNLPAQTRANLLADLAAELGISAAVQAVKADG